MEHDNLTPNNPQDLSMQPPASAFPQPDDKPPLPPPEMLTPPGGVSRPPVQPAPVQMSGLGDAPQPAAPEPELTPPSPTVPTLFPEEGFRQPYIEGQAPFQPQYGGPTPPKEPVVYASDYERIMALPPIPKQEAESCRHSHEKRWYRRLIELNFLAIIIVISLVIAHFNDYGKDVQALSQHIMSDIFAGSESDSDSAAESSEAESEKKSGKKSEESSGEKTEESSGKKSKKENRSEEREKEREQADYMEDFAKHFPNELKLFFYGIFALISLFFTMYLNYASVKASSVRITQRNFPEIYALVHSFANRLGMEKVPEIYIVQQSGILNAFSAFLFGRQYIQINTEVFEVAYREHKDMNALAFILAHELSHIYFGHATLHYHMPILFSETMVPFGQIASRTREYSCDRLAQRLTNYDGVQAIMMLMVDRHLYPMVDVQDYVETTINDRGFFLWLVNMFTTHPIMPKRLRALIQWHGSGELY